MHQSRVVRILPALVKVSLLCLLPRLTWPLGQVKMRARVSEWLKRLRGRRTHGFHTLLQRHFPQKHHIQTFKVVLKKRCLCWRRKGKYPSSLTFIHIRSDTRSLMPKAVPWRKTVWWGISWNSFRNILYKRQVCLRKGGGLNGKSGRGEKGWRSVGGFVHPV